VWIYLGVFLSALVADSVPIVVPSSWIVMVFLLMKFHLQFLPLLIAGVCGSTLARYLHSLYMPKLAGKFLRRAKHEELELLGRKLIKKGWHRWLFVFFYTMTPLPDTVLFTAAGMAKMNPLHTVVPFFFGRLMGCAVLIFAVVSAVGNIRQLRHGMVSSVGILTGIIGLTVLAAVLFIDWRAVLEQNRFRFRFKIWKR
jgi:membrane protein YqaA with SNARE-associated domain